MKVECPCCDGAGEKYDSRKTYRTSLQPYYTKCPLCLGKGEICEEDAEDFDEDKTLADYEEERESDAWEAREEARREARWDR